MAQRLLRIVLVAAVVYLGWVFLDRETAGRRWIRQHAPAPAPANAKFDAVYGGSAVKILQFYARDGVLTEGDCTVLCYGVLNARSVRIEPPVEGVGVALNRCVSVAPERDTRYTLTAEGSDGRSVSESFQLPVVADPATLPKITSFRIAARKKDYLGRPVFLLSYALQNAEEVSIDPPVFEPLHRTPLGRFYVRPDKTTTYTLIVKGKHGHVARQQLTVEVPERK
jgi:hypothetical protein